MADIEFNCPKCYHLLAVDEKGAGRQVNCPKCGSQIIIPMTLAAGEIKPKRKQIVVPYDEAMPTVTGETTPTPQNNIVCPKCRAFNPQAASFCMKCASPLQSQYGRQPPPSPPPIPPQLRARTAQPLAGRSVVDSIKGHTLKVAGIIFLSLVGILGLVYCVFFSSDDIPTQPRQANRTQAEPEQQASALDPTPPQPTPPPSVASPTPKELQFSVNIKVAIDSYSAKMIKLDKAIQEMNAAAGIKSSDMNLFSSATYELYKNDERIRSFDTTLFDKTFFDIPVKIGDTLSGRVLLKNCFGALIAEVRSESVHITSSHRNSGVIEPMMF